MAKTDTTSTKQTQKNQLAKLDIELAKIDLGSACDAIAAITNAVEIIAGLDNKPANLISHTIPRLMAHAHYLASTLDNNMGCFIEKVEEFA